MSSTGKITNLLPALSLPLSFQDWLPLAHFSVLTGFTAGALALRAAMLVAAMMLDRLIGEPDMLWNRLPHPVVLFGRIITAFDRLWNQRRRVSGRTRRCRGIITALALLVSGILLGLVISAGGPVIVLAVLVILLAGRSLDDHIRAVATALDSGIGPARLAVGMVVGRSTADLDEGDIARAAIETGAENLSDGVFAPAFWFLLTGLPGLIAYKIINTADSMIGYRNARYLAFGSGAARLDDLLNLVPARITALLICLAALFRGRALAAIRIMLRDGKTHASPNAGWPEAAMAGALDVWLAGPRRYGRRLRHAPRFHETGTDADAAAILSSLRLLAGAQIIFAILMAAMIGLPALVNAG
jgi:adenosylcobinamide-phosphate synthase